MTLRLATSAQRRVLLAVAFVIVVAAIFLIPRGRKRRPAPSVEAWKQ